MKCTDLIFFLTFIAIGNPAKDVKLALKYKKKKNRKNQASLQSQHIIIMYLALNFNCFFRDGHSACVIQDAMYIFGGYSEASFSYTPTVFRLDLNNYEWTLLKCEGSPPIYRDFHTATAIDNKMFVFGGRSDNSNDFTQTEIYSDRLVYLVRDFL